MMGRRGTLADAELRAQPSCGCSQLCQAVSPPAWGQDSAPGQQDGRCYQTAQLAQRRPPSAAKSGPWAPAAGRGKRRQDVLSCGRQVLSHEPLLTSLATWRGSPTRHPDLRLLAGPPTLWPGLGWGVAEVTRGAGARPGRALLPHPGPAAASPECPHLPARRLLPSA